MRREERSRDRLRALIETGDTAATLTADRGAVVV